MQTTAILHQGCGTSLRPITHKQIPRETLSILKCLPSSPLSPNARPYCAWLGLHGRGSGKAASTAGEAAEPSAHNGAPREGEGSRLQRGREPGSRNVASLNPGPSAVQSEADIHLGCQACAANSGETEN
ncbi:hypothetical protein EYF80_036430 [Liparis tanakae]|uniref:Uncharacterized protein n=1 Tax=Liparis tanakae TaxID=230148 RepID=A0A4Z2GKH6_9TELE|nr:hypothetical protein EYF80_036430 [Liparis tanakae]